MPLVSDVIFELATGFFLIPSRFSKLFWPCSSGVGDASSGLGDGSSGIGDGSSGIGNGSSCGGLLGSVS
jgi:hypothetical protein